MNTLRTILSVTLLLFVTLFTTSPVKSNDVLAYSASDYSIAEHSCLVYSSDVCSIYEVELEDGTIIFQVVAAIATAWLPEIVEAFCERTVGDPVVCSAVYDVTSMVVALRGASVYSGITKGLRSSLRWIANRGFKMSSATIEASTYNTASAIKDVFELYRKSCERGSGIKWSNVGADQGASNFNANYYSFYTYKECKIGRITGNRVNYRTTPSIEGYNKIFPLLTQGERVTVVGYQVAEGNENMRLTSYKTTFHYGNQKNFMIEKGIAVKYISSYNSKYDNVILIKKNGTQVKGVIAKMAIQESLDHKRWYKIKANGRTGWVLGDFLSV